MPRSTACAVLGDDVTPGWSSVSWLKSRPFSGNSLICACSTRPTTAGLCMATSVASAVTTTRSANPPSFISTLRAACWPTESGTRAYSAVRNPDNSTVMS